MATGAGPEDVVLTVGQTDVRDYNEWYTETNCSLREAVAEYDIKLQNYQIIVAAPPSSRRVIALANNTFFNTSSNAGKPLAWAVLVPYLHIYTSANASFDQDVPKETLRILSLEP